MPSRVPRLAVLCLALGAGFAAGCFKDSPSGDGGESGGCEEGSQGCACYGNGTCDLGLECSMGVCVPEGCMPGQELCTCVDGECLGDLVCEEGTCKEAPSESGTAGTDETTDGMETGTTDVTDTMVSFTDSAEFSTTEPTDCDFMGDCSYCTECAVSSTCAEYWNACQANPECATLFECLQSCDPNDPDCAGTCYDQYPNGIEDLSTLYYCLSCTACFNSCDQGGMSC